MHKIEAGITDIFSSVQGEGIFVGAKQIFVRFQRCNLNCVFCDERKDAEGRIYTPASLMEEIGSLEDAKGMHHSVSLTGGEPLMYSDFLKAFLPLLRKKEKKSYLETNGTLPDELAGIIDLVDIVAMDFKLPSSTGERGFWDEHFEFLKIALKKNVFVKAVVTPSTTAADVEKAVGLIMRAGKNIPFILQPATPVKLDDKEISRETLLKFLEIGLRNDLDHIRVIPQVHKMLRMK
jgi:organic radical activating enzyme